MKPFNLEEALKGEFCVTRNGCKVRFIFDKSELDPDTLRPLVGYVFGTNKWGEREHTWGKSGNYCFNGEHIWDIVGMYEERQPEVTITFPAPLKVAAEGQEVWYFGFNPTEYSLNPQRNHTWSMTFKSNTPFHQYLLNTGQLFKTKEDCQAFLDALKGARR